MAEYSILKFDPIIRELGNELYFYRDLSILDSYQESDENYMFPGFGKNYDDISRALQHFAYYVRVADDSEEAKREVFQDFQNLFLCLPYFSSTKDYIRKLIPILISIGLAHEVANTIMGYFRKCQIDSDERATRQEVLNFPDIYEKAGDYALYMKNDPETALTYYRLAGANWNARSETDNRSNRQKEYYHVIPVYEKALNCEKIKYDEWSKNTHFFRCNLNTHFNNSLECLSDSIISDITPLDVLVVEVSKLRNSRSEQLRIGLLMIEGIRRKYALKILHSACSTESREQLKNEIISWTKRLYDRRYEKLKKLALNEDLTQDEKIKSIDAASETACFVDRILNTLRVDSDKPAAYYTSYRTFSYLFPDNYTDNQSADQCKLSVMHISYMNDPNEGKTIQKAIFGKVEEEKSRINPPYVFLKCFTPMKDYLPMWNMYGDSAKGVCVLIDTDGINDLYHVCYVDDDNGIKEQYNRNIGYKTIKDCVSIIRKNTKILDREILNEMLEPIRYLFKDKTYSYEQEIRMVFSFDRLNPKIKKTSQNPPKLMVHPERFVQIKEIMLGPKFADVPTYLPYIQEQMDRMAEITKLQAPDITVSHIDFR